MPTIERQGARIHYEISGGEGPPVLLGHSLLCDGRMWEGVAPALAAKHKVINIDARGHGRSSAPTRFTLEDLADDWLAIMEAERIPRAALVGLSMGGMTAMRVALRSPERVAGMVLIDSNAEAEAPLKRIRYGVLAETLRRLGVIDPLVAIGARIMFGKTTRAARPEIVAGQAVRLKEQDPMGLYHGCRAVFSRPSIERRLPSIKAPTLVLVGSEDVATPLPHSQRIAAGIPDSLLVVIPRVGHLAALEAPELVAREVLAHLARCSS